MKSYCHIFLFLILASCFIFVACQPNKPLPETLIQTPVFPASKTTEATPTKIAVPKKAVNHGELLATDTFGNTSPLCGAEPDTSAFTLNCSNEELGISQSGNRRKLDVFLFRDFPIQTGSFSLEVETLSMAAQSVRSDQNSYGIYFLNESGQYRALRVSAQYFDFETWSVNGNVQIKENTNLAFSPFIKPAGQNNTLRLDCSTEGCKFFANGNMVGSLQNGINGKVKAVGFFAESDWNKKFGQVSFKNLQVFTLPNDQNNSQLFSIEEPLTSGSVIFTGTGLSGAFNRYEVDGFHFSPVVPYGTYAVKGGPALGNMSVEVTVKMEINPNVSSSRYAGVVCRSSLEGMVMAVVRGDGTYTIFRDSPQRPFALLAEKASEVILPGFVENKLRLDCIGDQIDFYINNAQVESLTDTRYGLRFGRAGLFTKAGGTPDADAVIFSNFSITEVR
jgi:hypothetical protein